MENVVPEKLVGALGKWPLEIEDVLVDHLRGSHREYRIIDKGVT